jgi:hypothetical protein
MKSSIFDCSLFVERIPGVILRIVHDPVRVGGRHVVDVKKILMRLRTP